MNINYTIKFVLGVLGICLLVGSIGLDSTGMAMAAIACALFTNFIPSGERKALPLPPEPTLVIEEKAKPKPEPKSVFKCKTCDKEFETEEKLQRHIGVVHWKDIGV